MKKLIVIVIFAIMSSGCASTDMNPWAEYTAMLKEANKKGLYPNIGETNYPVIIPAAPMVPMVPVYYNYYY
jgi:PBP1b-binding outer membrane lipoprotein LpoB